MPVKHARSPTMYVTENLPDRNKIMPIYEFKCKSCHREFESLVASFSAVDTVKCEQCGSSDITRILSTVNSKVQRTGSVPTSASPGCRSKSGFS